MTRRRIVKALTAAAMVGVLTACTAPDWRPALEERVLESVSAETPTATGVTLGTASRGMPWSTAINVDLWIPGADTMSNPDRAAAMLAAYRTVWLDAPFEPVEVGVCLMSAAEPDPEEWDEHESSMRYDYEVTGVNPELSDLLPGHLPGLASRCHWTYLAGTLQEMFGTRD
jgi:hypothetical protein